nr:putative glycoprotein [Takachi virus]
MPRTRSKVSSIGSWGRTLLTLYLCSSWLSLGSSQETSTSSSSAQSRRWGRLQERTKPYSPSLPQSSYEKAIEQFQERHSRLLRLATSESCQPWPPIKGVGTSKHPRPLWSKLLTTTYHLGPSYGIALGNVTTGARKRPIDGDCPTPSLSWQMDTWVMDCSDEKAQSEGCERNQRYLYEYDTNIDRTNVLWKYDILVSQKRTDLGNCTVRDRQTVGTVWGSHKEIYPLLDVPEGKLDDNTARERYNVIVLPNGRCVFRPNKFERYRLETATVEPFKVEYSAPFKVVDQLTPHGPSVGRIDQNQPDPTVCLVRGRCDYPLEKNPCSGPTRIDIRQTMVLTQTEGPQHRLVIEVGNPRGPCNPVVVADTHLEEIARVHGPTSTKLFYNLALHHSVITVHAGDTWQEYSVSKNVIRPSTSSSQTTPPYHSTGTTGSLAGLAISLMVWRGSSESSRGWSSL